MKDNGCRERWSMIEDRLGEQALGWTDAEAVCKNTDHISADERDYMLVNSSFVARI